MRFSADEYRVYLSVTELASYAYQRENVRLLAERFGFVRLGDDATPEGDVSESSLSPQEHGTALHHVLQTDASLVPGVMTEVPLERSVMDGDFSVCVQGFADSISYDGANHTVEEIKTVSVFPRGLSPFSDPAHFAQAAVYAHLYCERYSLPQVFVKLTFMRRSDGEKVSFRAPFTRVSSTHSNGRTVSGTIQPPSDVLRTVTCTGAVWPVYITSSAVISTPYFP